MSSRRGFLLIADITGYTSYLSGSELEHAQGVLTSLIELLIRHTKPPLVISRLAGDAVISYALEGAPLQGQTLVEEIEDTYVAFRKSIERMILNNTCQCNACANVSALDLKFFVHHGTFGVQKLGGHDELVGTDVNLIHRLLKNGIREKTGIVAYTAYTEAALEALGMGGFAESLTPHEEAYDVGRVSVRVQDMRPVWERARSGGGLRLPPSRVLKEVAVEIAAPPTVVWDALSQPEIFKMLSGSDRWVDPARADGRIAQGSVFQCYHGDKVVPLTVLEWQPFERLLIDTLVPLPVHTTVMTEYRLEPTAKGTRFIQAMAKARGNPLGVLLSNLMMGWWLPRQGRRAMEAVGATLEATLAAGRVEEGAGSASLV